MSWPRMIQPFSKAISLHNRDRQTLRTPLSLLPHRPNTKPMADTMPREPARNKEPRKEPTNFVARFRFSGQISNRATFFLPKCVFPTHFIPPNWVFRHFSATTGVCDVARFQKTAEKWNRATFTECGTCQSGRNHAIMARKTHPRRRFSYILTTPPSPPIGNRNQEPRKHHHPDRNDSYPDIEGYIAKAAARKQKAPRQCPGLYDVVPYCRLFPEK